MGGEHPAPGPEGPEALHTTMVTLHSGWYHRIHSNSQPSRISGPYCSPPPGWAIKKHSGTSSLPVASQNLPAGRATGHAQCPPGSWAWQSRAGVLAPHPENDSYLKPVSRSATSLQVQGVRAGKVTALNSPSLLRAGFPLAPGTGTYLVAWAPSLGRPRHQKTMRSGPRNNLSARCLLRNPVSGAPGGRDLPPAGATPPLLQPASQQTVVRSLFRTHQLSKGRRNGGISSARGGLGAAT